jgi:hypothetical protein
VSTAPKDNTQNNWENRLSMLKQNKQKTTKNKKLTHL